MFSDSSQQKQKMNRGTCGLPNQWHSSLRCGRQMELHMYALAQSPAPPCSARIRDRTRIGPEVPLRRTLLDAPHLAARRRELQLPLLLPLALLAVPQAPHDQHPVAQQRDNVLQLLVPSHCLSVGSASYSARSPKSTRPSGGPQECCRCCASALVARQGHANVDFPRCASACFLGHGIRKAE